MFNCVQLHFLKLGKISFCTLTVSLLSFLRTLEDGFFWRIETGLWSLDFQQKDVLSTVVRDTFVQRLYSLLSCPNTATAGSFLVLFFESTFGIHCLHSSPVLMLTIGSYVKTVFGLSWKICFQTSAFFGLMIEATSLLSKLNRNAKIQYVNDWIRTVLCALVRIGCCQVRILYCTR